MSSTQEIIRIADNRNKSKGQVTYKAINNDTQIVVEQTYINLITQSWMQQDIGSVVTKTLIAGNASGDLTIEISLTLDNVVLDQVYKQQIKQGKHSISINKLLTDVRKGTHKLVVAAKVDNGSFTIDISNSNQFITYK